MIGRDENYPLAIVDDKNDVVGSVSLLDYEKNPKKYKMFCIRFLVVSENKDVILYPDSYFGGKYDTKYFTILRVNEDYETLFSRMEQGIEELEKRFLLQYDYVDDNYDLIVRLYMVRQTVEEARKNDISTKLYPYEVKFEEIEGNKLLASEIDFFNMIIYPVLDLDISRF